MKRFIGFFIFVFMISFLLVGCTEKPTSEKENDQSSIGGEKEETLGNKTDEENKSDSTTDQEAESENKPVTDQETESDSEPEPEPEPDPEPELTIGTAVGDLMANVTLEKVGGGTVSIEDFKGKIIIFNIWATWCSPCRAELPDFDKIANAYSEEVVVIAAHLPSGSENAPSYVATNFPDSKIHFAYDTSNYGAFFAAGGVNSVPRTAILDERGVIVYAQDGMMYYEQLISIIESIKGQ